MPRLPQQIYKTKFGFPSDRSERGFGARVRSDRSEPFFDGISMAIVLDHLLGPAAAPCRKKSLAPTIAKVFAARNSGRASESSEGKLSC